VTEETIKTHMKSILSKLDASDRSHAVAIAIRRGIINGTG
jgi:DNA-binding CsgD family transcriptional regulator